MQKRTLTITIIIFILITVGVFVYFAMDSSKNGGAGSSAVDKIFSPFGFGSKKTTNPDGSGVDVSSPSDPITVNVDNSKFKQITDFPVAGATFFVDQKLLPAKTPAVVEPAKTEDVLIESPKAKSGTKKTESKQVTTPPPIPVQEFEYIPSIRYIKKSDGHIYGTYLTTKITSKISNSTIPKIHEGIFASNPNNIIYRLLGNDESTIKTIPGVLGSKGVGFLPDNIVDLSISPNGNNIFYMVPNSSGILGVVGSFSESKIAQIFSSPFTEWLTQWPTAQTIFITTKASYNIDGYMYSLNSSTGKMVKILSKVKGLTTLADPTGDKVLYNTTTQSGPKLGIYTISKNSYTDTGLYGLPEKCTWSNENIYCAIPNEINGFQYPDVWYQGQVSFNDTFYQIQSGTGVTRELANSTLETPVDGVHLFLDDKDQTIYFINKKDSTLWSLSIK